MEPTAVVTGGAGGMGLATARILGRDHRVVIADVSQERLDAAVVELKGLGVDATAVRCDITSAESVASLFATAGEGGHVRAVVHTAGVSPQMGDAAFIARVNAVGTVNVARAFLPLTEPGDALVAVASIAGHMLPGWMLPRRTYRLALRDVAAFSQRIARPSPLVSARQRPGYAYSTSKAFVIWYTAAMAEEFGARGARIVSVSPGTFDTAMGRLEEKSGAGKLGEIAALRRVGRPDEVAEVLAFCASTRPGYLTGTDVLLDGGTKAGLTPERRRWIARGA